MGRVLALLRTSTGHKLLMAGSGLALFGFLLIHLLGNLYLLQGREALNAYAAWLKGNPLLWPARLGQLAIFGVHIAVGVSLARRNRRARPEKYHSGDARARTRTLTSRSMIWTGLVALAFVIFHLAHFTFGAVLPEAHALRDSAGRHDVYGMVVEGFRHPAIAATYALAMGLLALHLAHAGWSWVRTVGLHTDPIRRIATGAGLGLAALITVGNLSLPLLVFFGLVGPTEAGGALASGLPGMGR